MSGLYLSGMKMPENGETITITICDDGIVFEECKEPGSVFKAIPVPPHGRLVDADALIKGHFSDEHRIAMSYADKCWMRRIINGEPTIIPAEEK